MDEFEKRNQRIVDEMIERLRLLGGTQDMVPKARRIDATGYLVGGGDLSEDRSISLDDVARRLLERVADEPWPLKRELDSVRADLSALESRPLPPRAWVRDFSFHAQGAEKRITAPPIAVGKDCRLRHIFCAVDKGGETPEVSVNEGRSWYIQKNSPGRWNMNSQYTSGEVINLHLKLPNDKVTSGTVSLFFEED